MSAFIVSLETIDAIVTYAVHNRMPVSRPLYPHREDAFDLSAGDADAVGQQLVNENHASVNHRYRHLEIIPVPNYVWTARTEGQVAPNTVRALTPITIVKLCHCLAYQSCEHGGWTDSWANHLLDSVIAHAARSLGCSRETIRSAPGYAQAPWGLT